MATANSIKTSTASPILDQQSSMIEQIKTIRQAIKAGATGFLFAATMPNGEMRWFAAGNLDSYGREAMSAAMRLYGEAQDFAMGKGSVT